MFARKCYAVTIADKKIDQALAPTFSVTIAHSTIGLSDADRYVKSTDSGFKCSIDSGDQLTISITPQAGFDESDKLFRNAYAMLTRYKLTSREAEEITRAYESYLARFNVKSSMSAKRSNTPCLRTGGGVC